MPDADRPGLIAVTEVAAYAVDGVRVPAGVHHSLGSATTALAELADLCGLSFRAYRSVAALADEQLEGARAIALLTIGNTPWSQRQREIIERRVREGSLGVLGLHCATDASHDWPEYGELLGARFDGHPVTAELPVAVLDPTHPATVHLPPLWRFHDELYLFRDVEPGNDVLLAIRMGPDPRYAPGAAPAAGDLPVAWSRSVGAGRVFYTALGHFAAAWEDRNYVLHVLGGLRCVLDSAPVGAR